MASFGHRGEHLDAEPNPNPAASRQSRLTEMHGNETALTLISGIWISVCFSAVIAVVLFQQNLSLFPTILRHRATFWAPTLTIWFGVAFGLPIVGSFVLFQVRFRPIVFAATLSILSLSFLASAAMGLRAGYAFVGTSVLIQPAEFWLPLSNTTVMDQPGNSPTCLRTGKGRPKLLYEIAYLEGQTFRRINLAYGVTPQNAGSWLTALKAAGAPKTAHQDWGPIWHQIYERCLSTYEPGLNATQMEELRSLTGG